MLTSIIGLVGIIILVVAGTLSYVGTVVNFSAAQGEEIEPSRMAAAVIAGGCAIIVFIAWLCSRFTGSGFLIPLVLSCVLAFFAWRYASNGVPLTLPIGFIQFAIMIAAGIGMKSAGITGGGFVRFFVIMTLPIIVTLIASIVFHSRAYDYEEEETTEEDDDESEDDEEPEETEDEADSDEDETEDEEREPRQIPWLWIIVLAAIGVLIWVYAAFFVPAYPNLNILNLFK